MKASTYNLMAVLLLSSFFSWAQNSADQTLSVKISGNCGMCKKTIEAAGNVKNQSTLIWDEDTQQASLTFDPKKTSADAILKRVALAGYDNEKYLATAETYANLHACCQYDRVLQPAAEAAPSEQQGHAGHQHHALTQGQQASAAAGLQSLVAPYLHLKDALVASDIDQAKQAAAHLGKQLENVKAEGLSDAEKTAWAAQDNKIRRAAKALQAAKNLAQLRTAFADLSIPLYATLKSAGSSPKLHYQYCPMYNDGKGAYWLSNTSAIKNPYYGSQMLSCGKTVETID